MTISYGGHPNAVFYLFYGFLPGQNPHDAIVLFSAKEELKPYMQTIGGLQLDSMQPPGPLRCGCRLLLLAERAAAEDGALCWLY